MSKAIAFFLIALIGGATLYVLYQGVILPLFEPYFKTRQ